jgi:predicted DNA-binding protein YlxM (UPF0122 family)
MITHKLTRKNKRDIINLYVDKRKSTSEVSNLLNISRGAIRDFLLREKKLRTRAEGNSLKWNNLTFKDNQIKKRVGHPSGANGKNWKLKHIRRNIKSSGNKNHNWKGGRTKLIFSIRSLPEYSIWRTKIFRRDDWTCSICKRKRIVGDRVILQADHITPLWKIIEKNHIKNIQEAISCKELWDEENGRTLCKECHKKTETYGVNKNGS